MCMGSKTLLMQVRLPGAVKDFFPVNFQSKLLAIFLLLLLNDQHHLSEDHVTLGSVQQQQQKYGVGVYERLDSLDWKDSRAGAEATSLGKLFQLTMMCRKPENFL